ncbi:hypothetical protein LTR28_006491 [Elasticomyces elasticus]|nr:hypothetical protein LTR28_006491 [Elasticomyces elasticus]
MFGAAKVEDADEELRNAMPHGVACQNTTLRKEPEGTLSIRIDQPTRVERETTWASQTGSTAEEQGKDILLV